MLPGYLGPTEPGESRRKGSLTGQLTGCNPSATVSPGLSLFSPEANSHKHVSISCLRRPAVVGVLAPHAAVRLGTAFALSTGTNRSGTGAPQEPASVGPDTVVLGRIL